MGHYWLGQSRTSVSVLSLAGETWVWERGGGWDGVERMWEGRKKATSTRSVISVTDSKPVQCNIQFW